MDLDTSFLIIISQIINMKPLPFVNNAYGRITSEELAHDIACDQDTRSEGVAFAMRTMENPLYFVQYVTNLDTLARIVFKLSGSLTGGKIKTRW